MNLWFEGPEPVDSDLVVHRGSASRSVPLWDPRRAWG